MSMLAFSDALDKENAQASIGVRAKPNGGGLGSRNQTNTLDAIKNNAKSSTAVQPVKQLASLLSSQQKQPSSQRRAFGDITNKASQHQTQQAQDSTLQKPKHSVKLSSDNDKAELYAMDGVERLAGKGWEEMEADRKRQEEKKLADKVKTMQAAMIQSLRGTPSAFRLRDDEDENDDKLDFTPEVVTARPSRHGTRTSAAAQREKAAAMWGSVPLTLEVGQGADLDLNLNLSSPFISNCPSLSDLLVSSEEEDLLL